MNVLRRYSAHRVGLRLRFIVLAACVLICLVTPGGAGAQTTHKYLTSWPMPVASQPAVQAVDGDGYVYVASLTSDTVSKFDPDGNPANFSALGTNTIDGAGLNCPIVPADCDRVPVNHLNLDQDHGSYTPMSEHSVAVDSSGGSGDGLIYVVNLDAGNNEEGGAIEVFASSGEYLGALDKTTFPENHENENSLSGVSVNRNGVVFVAYQKATDQYAPVDGDPNHHDFIGQLRNYKAIAGVKYTYVYGGQAGNAQLFSTSVFQLQVDPVPVLSKGTELFGDGGDDPEFNSSLGTISLDPFTEDVYLIGLAGIEQWDVTGQEQIGVRFGTEAAGSIGATAGVAADRSGGPTEGRLYVRGTANGSSSVAVYSPPVPIPDVKYATPVADHNSVVVGASIELDGGPPVTECRVEWGQKVVATTTRPAYEMGTKPCDVPTPYGADTQVSTEITGLLTETNYFYRIVATNSNGVTLGAHQIMRPAAVVGVEADPPTDITTTEATLHGRLDPDGLETEYHFEYGLTTNYDQASQMQTAPPSSGEIQVTPAELAELQAGRTYHYRLVAQSSLGTSASADHTFIAASPPRISGVRTTDVTETSATLRAKIKPFGYSTTYKFEYGPSPEYGTSVPVPSGDAGSGTEPVEVDVPLVGLTPGQTYHFRVIAANKWGTIVGDNTTFSFAPPNCPNAHIRQVTGATYLPDCRAYELVSPGNAAGVQLFSGSITDTFGGNTALDTPNEPTHIDSTNTGLAISPSRFSYWGAFGALPGTDPVNILIDMYLATRTPTGWVSTHPGLAGGKARASLRPQCSEEMDRCIAYKGESGASENPPERAPYMFDVSGNSRLIGRLPTNVGAVPGGNMFVGSDLLSGDYSHYFFSSRDLAFAPGGLAVSPGSAYDNAIGAATVRVASKLANGQDIPKDGGEPEEAIRVAASSVNGSHVLMTVDSSTGAVNAYMRVNGSVTYELGEGIRLVGMTANGREVAFISTRRLTLDDNDTSADLYVWSEATDSVTRISQGNGQGDDDSCNTTWVAGCSVQELRSERADIDSSMARLSGGVLFYSPENLDPDRPGVRNQRNLYLWNDGAIELVATMSPEEPAARVQIAPDGRRTAFVTASEVTGYDSGGYRMMYTYNAATQQVTCVSCPPSGAVPTADVQASGSSLFMADDGRSFFSTTDSLVPQDTNGGIVDVYEYVDGRPQLITTGTGEIDLNSGGLFYPTHKIELEGVSADGTDVYFSSFESLVPEDQNGNFLKFYSARTGGGFPVRVDPLPCVAADECHGPDSKPADRLRPATESALPGDSTEGVKRGRKTKRAKKRAKKRTKRAVKREHRAQGGRGSGRKGANHG